VNHPDDTFGIAPPPGFDWHQWVARWDRMQEHYLVRRHERLASVVALIEATQPRVERVLDLGCGPGSLTLALLEAFPQAEVYGIDFDPSVLLLAQARLAHFGTRVYLIQSDLRSVAWVQTLPASMDAVVSATALHWLEPDALVALYRRVAGLLRPGGILLNADHVGSEHDAVQRAWEQHRERERTAESYIKMGENEADDWDTFWAAYSRSLGYERASGQPSVDGWEGGVEKGLPLAWHLDRLRECGFYAADCFARWDCDALYGGIKKGWIES
jgi:trans-aconitate methyltransferase